MRQTASGKKSWKICLEKRPRRLKLSQNRKKLIDLSLIPYFVQYHSFHLFDLVYQFKILRLYISLQYIYSKRKAYFIVLDIQTGSGDAPALRTMSSCEVGPSLQLGWNCVFQLVAVSLSARQS